MAADFLDWGRFKQIYNKDTKETNNDGVPGEQLAKKYMKYFPDAEYENIWVDMKHRESFSCAQTLSAGSLDFTEVLEEVVYDDHTTGRRRKIAQRALCPVNHCFCLFRDEFLKDDYPPHQAKMAQNYSDLKAVYAEYPEVVSSELKYGLNPDLEAMRNQEKVLIVGGGPSINNIDFTPYKDIPVWTANNFWRSDIFDIFSNIQAVSLCDDVNIEESKLWDVINSKDILLLQEISDHGLSRVQQIKNHANKATFIHTRYRSKIGIGPRLLVLAILSGIKEIYFCGFDGYQKKSADSNHAFEKGKKIPRWLAIGGTKVQEQQYVMLWDYIYNTLATQPISTHPHEQLHKLEFSITDLSAGQPTLQYNFLEDIIK